ncbi:MAG: hypothetical protein Q8P10_02700 [bacterium]|nr:hypothetical protein [bacterium]
MNNKAKILDIAMNLNRVGGLAIDNYEKKKKRIGIFLEETKGYINSIDESSFPISFRKTFGRFLKEYSLLEKVSIKNHDEKLRWAEEMMTWGNILTHRAKFLRN